MGTTRIKVIDLSSDKKEIKTARKHAEKLSGVAKLKGSPKAVKAKEEPRVTEELKPATTEVAEDTAIGAKPREPAKRKTTDQTEETVVTQEPTKSSSLAVVRKHHHLGKKYAKAAALVDHHKLYPPAEALELLTKTSITRFDGTVEIHFNVTDKNLRGNVALPHHVTQKKAKEKKYLIFSDSPSSQIQAEEKPETKGPRLVFGNQKTIEEIAAGTLKPNRDFDKVLASPKFMPNLAKVAKILGPAGLMPNPKNDTIIDGDVKKFLAQVPKDDDGKLEYKTDPNAPIIHSVLGKLSDKPQNLSENLKTFVTAIGPAKITKAIITSTMGPGIRIDISALQAGT